jgi:hypothetical protein
MEVSGKLETFQGTGWIGDGLDQTEKETSLPLARNLTTVVSFQVITAATMKMTVF